MRPGPGRGRYVPPGFPPLWPSVFLVGQVQAHHGQLVDDLFQALAAQVAHLHHLVLGLGDQILHRVDVGTLEAVEGADRQIQLLDGQLQHLVPLGLRLLHHRGLGAHGLREVGEEDVKTQDELLSSSTAISVADVKGNDDEFGMDIADVGEIALDTPQEEEEEEVFMSAEQPPMFPGGMEALMKYLNDNIQYPMIALENGVSGTVVLQFVVSKTGKITDIKVLNSVDRALDEEAVRVVSKMPDWQPAKQNGNNVAVYFNLPVRFVIGQK